MEKLKKGKADKDKAFRDIFKAVGEELIDKTEDEIERKEKAIRLIQKKWRERKKRKSQPKRKAPAKKKQPKRKAPAKRNNNLKRNVKMEKFLIPKQVDVFL